MTRETIRKELLSLPPEDRLALAEELLVSLPDESALTEEEQQLIQERIAAHQLDPGAICSGESVMQEIDRALASKRQP